MTLTLHEFSRRFLLHILPKGFVKIRYYGLFSNIKKAEALSIIWSETETELYVPELLELTSAEIILKLFNKDITRCPKCNSDQLHTKLLKKKKRTQLE